MSIIQRLEQKAATREPVTHEDLAELHAHIVQIESSYQQIIALREREYFGCRVRQAA
jgi:hypothetical protein